jgi:acetyl esterase/lipase
VHAAYSTPPQHAASERHLIAGRYPVVTMRSPLAHRMTRRNLFGPGPIDAALVDAYSAERHVTRRTPPAFVAHARDDDIVSWRHAELFCNASHAHGVPCVFFQLRRGGHAFVTRQQPWGECKAAAAAWLRSRGLT